ncbi:MAG: phosphate regulon sensor histidine kinase PhoR [Pseudomonadota bacterium]
MPNSFRNALLSSGFVLLVGLAIGAYFGFAVYGLLIAMSGLFFLQLGRVLRLEKTLHSGRRVAVPDGDGVWARVLAGIHRQQVRVRKHKGRYRRLMKEVRQSSNSLPDAIVVLNLDHEIQRFNKAAERIVGLQKRRDRDQRIDNLLRHPDFVAFLRDGKFDVPIIIPSPKGEDCWISVQLVNSGQDSRLLILRDVTERTRLSRMRRDFVANASHELRTPLTVISGYLEAMEADSMLRDEWGKPLDEMHTQSQRMRRMLDELLALSQLEANTQASMEQTVDLATVVRDAVAMLETAHTVSIDLDDNLFLLGEYPDITSVVTNLMSNAMRYSAAGTMISVSWSMTSDGGALCVCDEGEGIAEDDIPRLTERFFRVNRGRGRDSGGVGLGLAIVKHALARHDATLSVESELGVGSKFRCHFPMERIVSTPVSVAEVSGGASSHF